MAPTPSATSPATLRSLYRALLRELPPRPILATPRTPLHARLRASFAESDHRSTQPQRELQNSSSSSSSSSSLAATPTSPDVAAQLVAYLQSQRLYATLLERYNPGMDMTDTDRVRLTARRVGMDLPVLHGDK